MRICDQFQSIKTTKTFKKYSRYNKKEVYANGGQIYMLNIRYIRFNRKL